MLQVPVFGMENNPDSLEGRRRGFAIAYGYAVDDYQSVTETIGHVPYVPMVEVQSIKFSDPQPRLVRVEFYSSVTPYSRCWIKVKPDDLMESIDYMQRGNLWTFQQASRVD